MKSTNTAATTAATSTGKMKVYREQLKSITNKLVEMAVTSGRKDYTANSLLRECYQLTTEKLRTFDQWKAENCSVKKGQHAYLFWGLPVDTPDAFNIMTPHMPEGFLLEIMDNNGVVYTSVEEDE